MLGTLSVNCNKTTVKAIAGKLSDGTGPASVGRYPLNDVLNYHSKALQVMHKELADWVELLCNTIVPRASICALMENRLCAMNK